MKGINIVKTTEKCLIALINLVLKVQYNADTVHFRHS